MSNETNLSLGALNGNIYANYKAAAAYYGARKKVVSESLKNKVNLDLEEISTQITKTLQEKWIKFSTEAYAEFNENSSINTVSNFIKKEEIEYDFSKFNKKNFSSQMGYLFEAYVEKEVKKMMNGILVQATGALTSKRAIFGDTPTKSTYIRPDIMLGMTMSITNADKENGFLQVKQDGTSYSVELDSSVVLKDTFSENGQIKQQYLPSLLEKYLAEGMTIGGLNIKQWSSKSSGKTITKNATLKNMINAQLRNSKPWEHNYAKVYVMYQVSKYLFGLLGPMNIAMISGDKWTWMDEWLEAHRLTYNLSSTPTDDDVSRAFYSIKKNDIIAQKVGGASEIGISKALKQEIDFVFSGYIK